MNRDVFIIGAGASVPYGFPTGFHLLQDIKSLNIRTLPMEILTQFYRVLKGRDVDLSINQSHLNDLVQTIDEKALNPLRNSCILSIDQFLKNHSDNFTAQYVVKSLMAFLILKAENESYKNRFTNNDKHLGSINWIQHLITRLDVHCKDNTSLENYLSHLHFITFNYDRVLEYYLYQYFIHDRNFTKSNAISLLNRIHIYHMNGYLGSLTEQRFGDIEHRDYKTLVSSMRTVWEDSNSDHKNYAQFANQAIVDSERIFILGTSYIPDNNEIIGLCQENINGKTIYGTGYGLSNSNIKRVLNNLGLDPHLPNEFSAIKDITAMDLIIDEYNL